MFIHEVSIEDGIEIPNIVMPYFFCGDRRDISLQVRKYPGARRSEEVL